MCRIAGILHATSLPANLEKLVADMCEIQKHGGPDDGGLYSAKGAGLVLGNRRLALLDLSPEGHMPMSYRDRYHITYNGELYNHISLREELISLGHRFSSHTDTEVILASFAQWGTQGFAKLKGMFAFALWDEQEQDLYIARDPAGIKPLYYSLQDGILAFASEARALALIPECIEAEPNWPVYMLAYGHLPEPVTTLKKVKPLAKGCFLKYEYKSGRNSLQSFTHYSYSKQLHDAAEVRKEIREALVSSVQRHLVADAPLGVFLSGGLDSSILAILASAFKKKDLNTLSIYFKEEGYSEPKYQDLVANKIGCQSHQYLLKEEEFHDSFPSILNAMDMPSSDGINTWFISQNAAKEGLKAVLSGLGGDELFGGYPSFSRVHPASLLQELPAPFISLGKRSRFKRLNRMSYLNLGGIKGIYLFLRGHYSPFEIARQLDMPEQQVWKILSDHPVLPNVNVLEESNQASWMEFNLYMQNQLLRDSDVMSMTHGVEIRVPFLDDDLVRLALRIAPTVKYRGEYPKQLLIDVFHDELPEEIWKRPKMGFSFPFSGWLGNSSFVKDIMSQGNRNTQASYQKFLKGQLHWSHLMSLVIMRTRGVS